MTFQNKVVLITGTGAGIGRASALACAAEGARVVVNYSRREGEAHETAEAIRAAGGEALVVKADVSDDAAVKAMVQQVVDHWGGIDILVNNAGTTVFADYPDLEAVSNEDWERVFAINVNGVWYCSRACAPSLRERGGAIINIASIAGFTGLGSSIPYSVSKGAVLTLTKSLARALAPQVRVNAIAPGFVDTRWHDSRPGAAAAAAGRTLLKKVPGAQEVSDLVLYLARAEMVTGQTFVIDAGMSM